MTAGRRGVALTPMEVRRDVIVRMAALADELGYEVFSVAEGWGLDSTVLLAEAATVTRRIRLVAGILSVWGRTPATIAMTAATLHQLTGGRFVLGLGASTPQLAEGWHDTRFDRPAAKLREVTAGVRSLLAGERTRPTAAPDARAIKLGQPPVPDLPIWIAASGARTVAVAAELGDGWLPLYLRRDRCAALAADIRARRPLTVAAGPFAVVDPDPDAARAVAAACTAAYLSAMGEVYPRVVAAQGLAEQVALVRAANPAPGRAPGVVPEEAQALLDEFTAYGDADRVRDGLKRWDDTVDITMVGVPPGLDWPRIEATLRAGAPD